MRNQFFGDKGLTSTSANHVANMAKEYIKSIQEQIDAISFIDETTSAGGHKYTTRKASTLSLNELESKLAQISQATQLIAWLREALKEKENAKVLDLQDWINKHEIDCPDIPMQKRTITEEEIIATWPVDKYNSFLTAQTNASVLGNFVHPGQPYSSARKKLFDSINNPVTVMGSGRDLTVIETSPAQTLENVDNTFFQLQAKYREQQAKYNQYRHEVDTKINEDAQVKASKYEAEMKEYQAKTAIIRAEYFTWATKEQARLRNLKIIIPDALKKIYDVIQGLSK